MTNQRFIELSNGLLLDLSQVEIVSLTRGDKTNRRYTVSFRSGASLEIYEDREECSHMRRQDFVDMLLNQNSQNEENVP